MVMLLNITALEEKECMNCWVYVLVNKDSTKLFLLKARLWVFSGDAVNFTSSNHILLSTDSSLNPWAAQVSRNSTFEIQPKRESFDHVLS